MNENLIQKLIHCTVRIECEDSNGQRTGGTGYIVNMCEDKEKKQVTPCIVTNKHVMHNAIKALFNLTLKSGEGPDLGRHEQVVIENIQNYCIEHPNKDIDLIAILLGSTILDSRKLGVDYFYNPLGMNIILGDDILDSLSAMESIVMIGYPNGLWDAKHNLPIVRQGATATNPKLPLNGKPEFLIDAACFGGSSGSPVFLANLGSFLEADGNVVMGSRIGLLGTLYSGPQQQSTGEIVTVDIPTDTKQIAIGGIPMNLGYVIQAKELYCLEKEVRKWQQKNLNPEKNEPLKIARLSFCPCGSGKRYKGCCGKIK